MSASYSFKTKSFDFIVEENLPYELSGQGDVLYIYIQKQNQTTQDVLQHITHHTGLSRRQIGIGGLKDKRAITRQRLGIYRRQIQESGGLKKLIRTLEALVKIIRMERHDTPLRLSTPITNTFHIRLRATQRLSQDTVTGTVTKIQQVLDEGFANLFGDQRFGIRGRNIALARELLEGKKSVTDTREIRRKLQAYGSYLFNHYLRDRLQEGKPTPMEGDIYTSGDQLAARSDGKLLQIHTATNSRTFIRRPRYTETVVDPAGYTLTGPVRGHNMLLARHDTAAGLYGEQFMQRHDISARTRALYTQQQIYGLRRPLWTDIIDPTVRTQSDDILIDFTLPASAYASVIIDRVLEQVQ